MAQKSLSALARELAAADDLPEDPAEAAEVLAGLIREERPTASVRGSQNAARNALGLGSVESDIRAAREATAPTSRRPSSRRSVTGRRRRRRAGRRVPALGLRRASSAGGLVAQALGLVALYWFLRYSGAAARIVAGAARALEWLRKPVPLGGSS